MSGILKKDLGFATKFTFPDGSVVSAPAGATIDDISDKLNDSQRASLDSARAAAAARVATSTPPPPPPPPVPTTTASTADDAVQGDPGSGQGSISAAEGKSIGNGNGKKSGNGVDDFSELADKHTDELSKSTDGGKQKPKFSANGRIRDHHPDIHDDAFGAHVGEDDIGDIDPNTGTRRGVINDYEDQSTPRKQKSIDKSVSPNIETRPNRLDPYSNYTYNIDLYALDRHGYNRVIKDRSAVNLLSRHLIISSGGKKTDRNPIFGDDFYIDELEVDNIAPTTEWTKNTLSANVKFTVHEPYGMTLLERLVDLARSFGVTTRQYSRLPYMLRISYFGYDDKGIPQKVPKTEKIYIISLWDLKFDASEGGARYAFQGIPYTHEAFTSKIDTIKSDIELSAKTVAEFLGPEGVVAGQLDERTVRTISDEDEEFSDITIAASRKKMSLAESLNLNEVLITENSNKQTPPKETPPQKLVGDKFRIIIDDEKMRNAIIKKENFDPNTHVTEKDEGNIAEFLRSRVQSLKKQFRITEKDVALRVNSGTSLIDVMSIVMLHSSYITDQFSGDPSKVKLDSLNWFKITPEIELLDWDETQGRFGYLITYRISTYPVNNVKVGSRKFAVPRGNIKGHHKVYDYLYTGQNDKVLGFDIKYNIAYHTISNTSGTSDDASAPSNIKMEKGQNVQNVGQPTQNTNNTTITTTGTGGKVNLAMDIVRDVLTNGIDLFNLQLEIIGDPDFMVQNDTFITNEERKDVWLPEGSINYDASPVYVKLNFKTPVDYDPETGLMDLKKGKQYDNSTQFSGIYELWKVKNTLSGGQFTQTLFGFRILDSKNTETKSIERGIDDARAERTSQYKRVLIDKADDAKAARKLKYTNDKVTFPFIPEDDVTDENDNYINPRDIYKGNIEAQIAAARREVAKEQNELIQRIGQSRRGPTADEINAHREELEQQRRQREADSATDFSGA